MQKTTFSSGPLLLLGAALLAPLVALSGLSDLMDRWVNDEAYGHGFVVVVVAAYMFLSRLPRLESTPATGSLWGLFGFAGLLAMLVISEAAQIHTFSQYLLIGLAASLAVVCWGLRVLPVIAPSVLLLVFAIPLPNFLQTMLTADLQLLSSSLGVWLLKLGNVPVYLQGNVIDLGTYKLQVVEACAGLNYLFPLLGIALICACYLRTPIWQRIVLVASAVPITVLLNSVRIAVTGLLVKNFGSEAADGFIHFFEGWLIFIACLLLLLLEMWLLAKWVNRTQLRQDLHLDLELPVAGIRSFLSVPRTWPLLLCLLLCGAALITSQALGNRPERIPARPAFALYPMQLGEWNGVRGRLSAENLLTLELTDYLVAEYQADGAAEPVEFYLAYYDSQKHNGGMHSPKVCLPGGGWDITEFGTRTVAVGSRSLQLNRARLQQGLASRLVYYWFQQGDRTIANELAVKVDVLRRSFLENTTNGALVRVSTRVRTDESIDKADARLQRFLEQAMPEIGAYIPR